MWIEDSVEWMVHAQAEWIPKGEGGMGKEGEGGGGRVRNKRRARAESCANLIQIVVLVDLAHVQNPLRTVRSRS